tara:strand:+ start:790 stop:1002 length:213 start_codon:yes stop_codon:yes gene_type:complete
MSILISTAIGQIAEAEIIISPIKGIMFGSLYHSEIYYSKEQEKFIQEYTLQCVIGIVSLNVVWERIAPNQ